MRYESSDMRVDITRHEVENNLKNRSWSYNLKVSRIHMLLLIVMFNILES